MDLPGFAPRELSTAAPISPPLAHVARFQDVDAAGVVFFARIIEYFHDAFALMMRTEGLPLEEVVAQRLWVAPIRESHASFLKPVRFGDRLTTAVVRSHLADTELFLGYRTENAGQPCAVGYTRAVFVDPEAFTRASPPAEVSRLFARLARPPVSSP